MAKQQTKTELELARIIFAEHLRRTGDYRAAAAHAGVSERTGRRWSQGVAAPTPKRYPVSQTNLQAATNRFIGRRADLEAIHRLFRAHRRLVTILGTAGMGKTRLARRYGELLASKREYAGGVWWCDLAAAREPGDVLRSLGQTLAVPLSRIVQDAANHLGQAIERRGDIVLILDNFEDVAATAADLVGSLLAVAPRARFLVTSRVRLGLRDEVLYELPPLGAAEDHSDAAALFIERVRDIRPDYEPSPRELAIIAEITRRLDGIPLAVELAAARMRTLSAELVRDRLGDRLELLAERSPSVAQPGAKPGDARQRTMAAEIERSWQMLTPAEQAVLAQCSVFRGGFSLTAAEAVIALEPAQRPGAGAGAGKPIQTENLPPVLDLLQALCDKSLLRVEFAGSSARYHMYEVIRAVAADKLSQRKGAADAAMARHTAFYLGTYRVPLESELPAADLDNLLAVYHRALAEKESPDAVNLALRALSAISRTFFRTGPLAVYMRYLDEALACAQALAAGIDPSLRAYALLARAEIVRVSKRYSESRRDIDAALALARASGDSYLEASALVQLGRWAHMTSDHDVCPSALTSAADLFAALGRPAEQAEPVSLLSDYYHARGELALCRQHTEAAIAIWRAAGGPRNDMAALYRQGALYHRLGQIDKAGDLWEEVIDLAARLGDRYRELHANVNTALVRWEQGDIARAEALLAQGMDIARAVNDRRAESILLGFHAALHHKRGHLDEARPLYEDARLGARAAGDRHFEGLFCARLGSLWAALDQQAFAEAAFAEAEALLTGTPSSYLLVALRLHRGELAMSRCKSAWAAGDRTSADAYKQEAEALLAWIERDEHAAAAMMSSEDVRFAHALLCRALTRGEPARVLADNAWTLATDGSGFCAPGQTPVMLKEGSPVRRVLGALVRQIDRQTDRQTPRHRGPQTARAEGAPMTVDELVACGWPGEELLYQAAKNRLNGALVLLRKLGLRPILHRRGEGYLLAAPEPMVIVDTLDAYVEGREALTADPLAVTEQQVTSEHAEK